MGLRIFTGADVALVDNAFVGGVHQQTVARGFDTDSFSPRGQQVIAHTPAGRFGEADEMSGAVRWLIDDDTAAFVTGICIPVDGGFLACSGL
jgi:NAD(P)-dependent dehydrogenase (short-subunit alcohol dehydrogenase family)